MNGASSLIMMILTILLEVLLSLLVACLFLGVVAFYASLDSLTSVFSLDFFKPLPVIVQAFQPLQLSEEVAFLDDNYLLVWL